MKKIKLFLIAITLFLMFTFTGCNYYEFIVDTDNQSTTSVIDDVSELIDGDEQKMGLKGKIFVNQVEITNQSSTIFNHDKFANLPVISIVKALGAEIIWAADNIANITYKGKIFQLNTTENYLREGEHMRNYIAAPPGLTHSVCYQTIDGDYFVDSDSMKAFFNAIQVKMTIDYDNLVVCIQSD